MHRRNILTAAFAAAGAMFAAAKPARVRVPPAVEICAGVVRATRPLKQPQARPGFSRCRISAAG
jgi:hypothetical protein